MSEILSAEDYRKLASKTKSKNGVKLVLKNKYLEDMKLALQLAGIDYELEYKFHPDRKWKFDIAIHYLPNAFFYTKEIQIAIEYEGLIAGKSRHTTITGYTGDCEKYNTAQKLGWIVLRYTALNYTSMIDDVRFFLNK